MTDTTLVEKGLPLVERLVRLEVACMRASGIPAGQDDYRGLYLSDEEIDGLLAEPQVNMPAGREARIAGLEAELGRARSALQALVEGAPGAFQRPAGTRSRLEADSQLRFGSPRHLRPGQVWDLGFLLRRPKRAGKGRLRRPRGSGRRGRRTRG